MSATDEDEVIPGREVAYRLFATEYDDASVSHTESDEERAPNYVIAPTGARINRLFAVGTLTEITAVNDEMLRARIVDPTGAFVVYAGQYQPDALATLESLEPPAFVAVTGKARTFQPDDSDRVYTSIRPESIATVDADTRDRWVVSAAEQTLERIGTYAAAADVDASGDELTDALLEADIEPGLAAGIPLAQDGYGTTPAYLAALRDCAEEAVAVVAGERDQVGSFDAQPDQPAPGSDDATFESLSALSSLDLEALETAIPAESTVSTPTAAVSDEDDAVVTDALDASSAAGTATGTPDSSTESVDVDVDESAEAADSEASAESETATAAEAETEIEVESEPTETESKSSLESEPTETDTDTAADAEAEDESAAETTTTFDETDAAADSDDAADAEVDSSDNDLENFDAEDTGMYEMDDDEREQLEEQFGAEFTTGSEVQEPGEAGIDVEVDMDTEDESADAVDESEPADVVADDEPATDTDDIGAPPESGLETAESSDSDESDADSEPAEASGDEDDTADDEADEPVAADEADEPAEDVDLQDYVIDTMGDLDDGDGADRSELVETVASDIGVSEDEVEDAIQDALMGGQCYEPNDDSLKPI
ncbi:hypothetical protein G6M89_00975 [Natronolimnobius sp. AArcel1]|uniref:RPA family protein n=1 Tax=Natronolimnobius sp. AArcel1 TaxID=1679093 RepID=UPI0013ED0CB5|nr:hypothetical protein [Natronolimnobius sp. AArcel1]NGM67591.1 hypothetical protein [Natronolimnobius sp. AArcel1]